MLSQIADSCVILLQRTDYVELLRHWSGTKRREEKTIRTREGCDINRTCDAQEKTEPELSAALLLTTRAEE